MPLPGADPLIGLRVLLIEDEAAVAMLFEDMLEELGCAVADHMASLSTALARLDGGGYDAVMLDMNLAGNSARPLAEELVRRGVPFVVVSGYADHGVLAPTLQKPFRLDDLKAVLRRVVEGAG